MASEDELREAADDLLAAGRRFWTARAKLLGSSAVVWVDDHDGSLAVFTRGEYRDQLLAAMPEPRGSVYVFADPATCYRDALEHIATGGISPAITFAQRVLAGDTVDQAHAAARKALGFDEEGDP